MCTHAHGLCLKVFFVQLEEKRFKQQEQIDSLQEQLKHDREKFQSKLTTVQNELGTKLDQVQQFTHVISRNVNNNILS